MLTAKYWSGIRRKGWSDTNKVRVVEAQHPEMDTLIHTHLNDERMIEALSG
jgi:hypothetical protein